MIVQLTPLPGRGPVPRVNVVVEPLVPYDGGGAGSAGPEIVDGGSAASVGPAVDGGVPAMLSVDVPPEADSVTLWRTTDGRRIKVRGAVDREYAGTLNVLDSEPGRGATAAYDLEWSSESGQNGTVALGSVFMPPPERIIETVIQQPLNPNLSVVVEELEASVAGVTREAAAELVYTEGAGYPRLVGFGPRRGLSDVPIEFLVRTREAAAAVWATLGSETSPQLPVWLIRSMHPLLPSVFFCEVRALRESPVNVYSGGEFSQFTATVTEIESPVPGLVVPSIRYSDLAAALGGTYSGIAAALPRYSQWASAREYAGAAG